jgi:hypothetical protein
MERQTDKANMRNTVWVGRGSEQKRTQGCFVQFLQPRKNEVFFTISKAKDKK